MYIITNAIRNISRSKGRSLLLGIILFVLVLCSALGLSIQQAAKTSQEASLDLTNISATIQRNMNNMFQDFEPGNKQDMKQEMQAIEDLPLDQLEAYAQLDVVKSFTYYATLQASSDTLDPIESTGPQFGTRESQNSGFTLVGYSSDEAMSDFLDGNASIVDGKMFTESTTNNECILPSTLATYNDISINDTITLTIDDVTHDFVVTGLYESNSIGQPGKNQDFSSNQIVTSANVVMNISDSAQIQGTYTFSNVNDYETFVDSIDLSDDYVVVSNDLQAFEQSLIPLQNLSTFSFYFVIIVLGIGSIVLVAINIFSIRERKQEIGILCAIGMKKSKIALQFFIENLCIATLALVLATGIVATTSVPLTNTLLQTQIQSTQSRRDIRSQNFGRQPETSSTKQEIPNQSQQPNDETVEAPSLQVNQISEAMNLQAFIQLIFIFILLLFISCMAGFISLIRYDPNQILANRD